MCDQINRIACRIGKEALKLTNEFRAKHKLPALAWHQVSRVNSNTAQDVTPIWCLYVVARGYWLCTQQGAFSCLPVCVASRHATPFSFDEAPFL
jgi:hypothetical protein